MLAEADSVFDELSDSGVLPSTPTWSATRDALRRLRAATVEGQRHDRYEIDLVLVERFESTLRRRASAMADALLCAAAVDAVASRAEEDSTAVRSKAANTSALKLLGDDLGLRALSEAEMGRVLRAFRTELIALLDAPGTEGRIPSLAKPEGSGIQQLDATAELTADVLRWIVESARDNSSVVNRAWSSTLERWSRWHEGGGWGRPTVSEVLAKAMGRGPVEVLGPDLARLDVAGWSRVVVEVLSRQGASPSKALPPWLAIAGLVELGFRMHETSRDRLLSDLGFDVGAVPHETGSSGIQAGAAAPVRRWLQGRSDRVLVVISGPNADVGVGWHGSDSLAILVIGSGPGDEEGPIASAIGALLADGAVPWLVVDASLARGMAPLDFPLARAIDRAFRTADRTLNVGVLYTGAPPGSKPPWPWAILKPRAEDVIAQLDETRGASQVGAGGVGEADRARVDVSFAVEEP